MGGSSGTRKGKMTRILLAEDQQVVRQALRCLIEREADMEVVGEASDGLEVLPLAERLKPDVLITDVAMPGLYGLEVARRVRELTPGTGVVILSRYLSEWYVTEALRSGALGYVVRQSDAAELMRAIRMAARGRRYLGPPLNQEMIDVWMARAARRAQDPYETLTARAPRGSDGPTRRPHATAAGVHPPGGARRLLRRVPRAAAGRESRRHLGGAGGAAGPGQGVRAPAPGLLRLRPHARPDRPHRGSTAMTGGEPL